MDDLIARLEDLYKQATVERSHYYVGVTVKEAIKRIEELEAEVNHFKKLWANAEIDAAAYRSGYKDD